MAKPKIPKNIQERADRLAAKLAEGTPWRDLGGKRMQHNRSIITFPVTRSWRLFARMVDGELKIGEVMSHENYSRGAKPGVRT